MTEQPPSLRATVDLWGTEIVEEWKQRTLFGKLLYPFWFVMSCMLWGVLAMVVASILIPKGVAELISRISNLFPNVYKEEGKR